jgi:L-aspartate oxidase
VPLLAEGVDHLDGGPYSRSALQDLMWERVGLARDGDGLRTAAGILAGWTADDPEDAGMLDLARAMVQAALARTESRGAHLRTDHPATDPAQARSRSFALPAPIPELVP